MNWMTLWIFDIWPWQCYIAHFLLTKAFSLEMLLNDFSSLLPLPISFGVIHSKYRVKLWKWWQHFHDIGQIITIIEALFFNNKIIQPISRYSMRKKKKKLKRKQFQLVQHNEPFVKTNLLISHQLPLSNVHFSTWKNYTHTNVHFSTKFESFVLNFKLAACLYTLNWTVNWK